MMFDSSELFTYHVLIYFVTSILLSFPFINIIKLILKAKSPLRQTKASYFSLKKYYVFLAINIIVVFWYILTIFNYTVLNSSLLLLSDRLAYAIVPWVAFFFALLSSLIANKSIFKGGVIKLLFIFELISSFLILFDPNVIIKAIPHNITGGRDIAIFGPHSKFYIIAILSIVSITIIYFIKIFRDINNTVTRQRLKILTVSFIASFFVTILFNLLLPFLGHPELIDYGVFSSLFVIYGIYIALEDKWVYSVQYLLATNLITWTVGLLLFVSVKFIELIMAHVFHLEIVNIKDLNAQLFGLLLGIGVSYSLNLIYKFSHDLGLRIFYAKYYKFRKKLDIYLYRGSYNKSPQKVAIKNVLMLLVNTFNIYKVCIFERNALYTDDYKICVENHEMNVLKKKKNLQKIQIKLMKNRFLNFYTDNKFIPKEFVDLLKLRRSSINALVNLDITSENLKTINTRLAKAVVTRTKKLDSIIEKQKKVIKDLKIELLRLKGFLPDIIKNMSYSSNAIKQYLIGLLKQTQGNKELQFIADKLYSNISNFLQTTKELMIFSDVVINRKLLKQQTDFRVFIEEIIDEWQVRYENKMVGLIKDVFTQHIKVTADYEKIRYILDFVLGTMLKQLSHGYVQAIGRIEGGYVRIRFMAKITGSTAAPVVDKEQEEILRKKLFLVANIIKLHGGLFSHSFENGFLSFIEFTLPISGI